MLTFNQWMAHIHRELGYPETKIKAYEQDYRSENTIQTYKRWSDETGLDASSGAESNNRIVKND
jgi:hypothetical protein